MFSLGWILIILAIFIGIPFVYTKKGIKHSVGLAYIIGVIVFSVLSYSFFGVKGILSSFIYSAQLFALGLSGKDLLELASPFVDEMNIPALIAIWGIYIVCPVLTISAFLTYIKKGLDRTALRSKFFKNVYIFTEKNHNASLLAKDICKIDKKALVIFAGTESLEDTFRNFCVSLPLCKVYNILNKTNKLHICFNDTDTDVLLDKLSAFSELDHKKPADIYVFSESKIAEEVCDGIKEVSKNTNIRIINTKAILVRNILWDYPLFSNIQNKNELNVSVLGVGGFGGYFASNVLWCGQIPDCSLKLNLVDRDYDSNLLRHISSNIFKEDFDIETFNFNIDTNDFFASIKNTRLINSDYIMICLGDDDLNIKIARELNVFFGRLKKAPFIVTLIENQSKFEILSPSLLKENITAVGGIENIYSVDNIFKDRYLTRAFEVYKTVEKNYGHDATLEDFYMQKQIDIYSSYANAVHCKYKVYYLTDNCLNTSYDRIKALAEEKVDILSRSEHDRWVAFERLKGYIGVPKNELEDFLRAGNKKGKAHKNEALKMHACIADIETVEEIDRFMESEFGIKQNLKEIDELIAAKTADLWFSQGR